MAKKKESQAKQEKKQDMKEKPKRAIFISHRHKDKKIADIFRQTLNDWTMNTIQIFQSSHHEGGPRVGQDLNVEITNALADANVLLLIYTYPDQDWSYCMWECGVATDPIEYRNTNIIVFLFTGTSPGPFHDRVKIPFTEDGIKKFTNNFHKEPTFFPNCSEAFAPEVKKRTINDRAKKLFDSLRNSFPELQREERRRWDMLTLSLAFSFVREVREQRDKKDWNSALKFVREKLPEICAVTYAHGEIARHFGFDRIMGQNYVFGDLIKRWLDVSGESPNQWIDGLYEEMTRAILNNEAEPTWYRMKSVRPGLDWWFVPIVNHVRVLPDEECIEFDLYFYRIPVDESGQVQLGVRETSNENA